MADNGHLRDEEKVVAQLEELVTRSLSGRKRLTPKEVISVVSLIATMVVALGGATTYLINTWTSYGWVTKGEFALTVKEDGNRYLGRAEYLTDKVARDTRNDKQDEQIENGRKTANEILAFVKIVPQLKTLIKIRCMGNRGVQPTIDSLKQQFRDLTGQAYEEPSCNDPEIKGTQ